MVSGKARVRRRFSIYHLPFTISLAFLIACSGTPSPAITVVRSVSPAVIEVRGLPAGDIATLEKASLSAEEWQAILRVSVQGSPVPMAGRYSAADGALRFTPLYEFDTWRSYSIRFDALKIPGATPAETWRARRLSEVVSFAGVSVGRSTTVTGVYPSGSALPENMLRFYIEFSAPMGRASALEHIRLIDEHGNHVIDPFLPVEAEFWSPDRTRFTLFFDPGRVKRNIKPNRDLGRALIPGRRYALVIGERWPDGRGEPLKAPHRHEFTVAPAIEKPLDEKDWTIKPPGSATVDPLVVTFPWALDHGLLQRALGVRRAGVEVPGVIGIHDGETRWTFTPRDPWTSGDYSLIALLMLEDPAGNRLGRAFEVMGAADDKRALIEIGFSVK